MRRLVAEFVGTFMYVTAVCGSQALSPVAGNHLPAALAVGLSVMAMALAVGHVSGGHFNPAVTVGLVAAGRHDARQAIPYVVVQLLGAIVSAFLWYAIASARSGGGTVDLGNFAANGYEFASPGHFSLAAVALSEGIATALLLLVIAGATAKEATVNLAPMAASAALTALLLLTMPISNGGLNPARSTATALFGGPVALSQLWLFWLAPLTGAMVGGLIARFVHNKS